MGTAISCTAALRRILPARGTLGRASARCGSDGAVSSIGPACRRVSSKWLIVVVMGEVPSPPSQLIDSVARPVSLEVDTEGAVVDTELPSEVIQRTALLALGSYGLEVQKGSVDAGLALSDVGQHQLRWGSRRYRRLHGSPWSWGLHAVP